MSKLIFVILSISLILMSITFLLPFGANNIASAGALTMKIVSTPPVRLSNSSGVNYAKLNKPTAVFVSGDITLIGDAIDPNSSGGAMSGSGSVIKIFDKSNKLVDEIASTHAPSDLRYETIGIFSLEDDNLVVYARSSAVSAFAAIKTFSGVTSFDIWENQLYVASTTGLSLYELTADFAPISTHTFSQGITSISSGYFASSNSPKLGSSIYQITGEPQALIAKPIMTQNWIIGNLIIDNKTAYYTTPRGLLKYNLSDKTTTDYSSNDYSFSDISYFNGKIYFTNAFDNRISAIETKSLSEVSVVFASNHAIDGFFDAPTVSVTRKDAIYTVDSGNNRITINRNNNFAYISSPDFVSLLGVAVSTKNEIYVLDKSNVYTYAQNRTLLNKKSLAVSGINKIIISSSDEIYVSSPSHIYKLSDMSVIKESLSEPVTALGASFNADTVLYAAGKSIFSTDSAAALVTCPTTVKDFCVDNARQLYVLDIDGNITKYSPRATTVTQTSTTETLARTTVTQTSTTEVYEPTISLALPQKHFSQITLCRINNSLVGFGDILVTSSFNHSLYKYSGADFEVATFDESKFSHPVEISQSKSDTISVTSQIAQFTTDVQIFEFPIESRTLINLPTNTTVVILVDSVTGFENFSYVMYHDRISKEAIYGYAYKQVLSPTAYTPPPSDSCKIFNDKTKIYRYPSNFSPLISENFSAAKNQIYEMLPFVDYVDSSDNHWFRVKIGDNSQGYVTKSNVSIRDYEPNLVRPQANAKIIATQAALYSMTNGKYTLLDNEKPLIQGTEIEVVGMLDPSKEFTLIRYFDSNLGTLECYIHTSTIEYYNINSAQIIAVVLLSITLLFGLILVLRKVIAKRA